MGRRNKKNGLAEFQKKAALNGITYAEAQKRETQEQMKRIRAPRTERSNGTPVYMKVSTRNMLRNIKEGEERNEMA